MQIDAVTDLIGGGLSLNKSLRLAGVAKSSWHYLHHPRRAVEDPVAHVHRATPAWLTAVEQEQIVEHLGREDLADLSPGEAFAVVLDEGTYIAPRSSDIASAPR